MQKTKKIKKRGFTLVELLITIGIIGIIFTISTISVYTIINNSKENSNKIAIENMKKSSGVYVKEYTEEISWNENNETCIPTQILIAKGYLKKEIIDNEDLPLSIILKKDEYNTIISEKEEYIDCDTYSRTVPIPSSEDICINYIYDGTSHNLINNINPNYSKIEYIDNTYSFTNNIHPINAGNYKVAIELINNKQWEDNTKDKKIITCKINKKTPNIELSSTGSTSTQLGTTSITLTSDITGKITIKSSNKKYVTAKILNGETINANSSKTIEITTLAQRQSETIITISITPTGEYAQNYTKTNTTYTIGPIKNKTINKPTCNELYYNAKQQQLAKTSKYYQLINNEATKIGIYTVTARLKYGYTWNDETTNDFKFTCEIKTPKPIVTYENATCNTKNITVTYNRPYGETTPLCIPSKTGYEFTGWYNNSSYSKQILNETTVTNFNNHNIYAQWSANTYNIKYNGNGNTGGTMANSIHTYDIAKKLSTNTFTKTGYYFVNWNTKANGTGTAYSPEANISNLTSTKGTTINLYAQWSANTYNIKYNGNGHTGGTMANSIHTYDIAKKLSTNTFTKTGYYFVNWNTKADGTGTSYNNEANILNLTATKGKTINLYAQWKSLSYSATPTTSTYTATPSCTNGRVLSNGNCIYETTCEEDCLGWRCDTGCGMCYICPDDPSEVCGCEDDGGKWIEYETTCQVPCSKTQNEYRKYTCPNGGTLSGTTCTLTTYSCPNGGTLSGTTCIFE